MFLAFAVFLQLDNLADKIYDPQFYIQTLREQDAYDRFYNDILLDEAVDRTAERVLGGTPVVIQEDLEPLLREIIPPTYLQEQVEANLSRAIEYLNEDAETLDLYLELEPILNRIEPALFAYIDRQIDQTQAVRPDPSRSIPEQVAEVEALIGTISKELARGRLPQAVPIGRNHSGDAAEPAVRWIHGRHNSRPLVGCPDSAGTGRKLPRPAPPVPSWGYPTIP